MDAIWDIISQFEPILLLPIAGFAFVGILAQWSLYDKCGLPGIDCIIPVKNVITFLKIMGRPASHATFVILPPVLILGALFIPNPMISYAVAGVILLGWVYFMTKVYIELCQCFGHYKLVDYVLVILFNGFYVLHLGLSYSEKYKGPVYHKEAQTDNSSKSLEGQLA